MCFGVPCVNFFGWGEGSWVNQNQRQQKQLSRLVSSPQQVTDEVDSSDDEENDRLLGMFVLFNVFVGRDLQFQWKG